MSGIQGDTKGVTSRRALGDSFLSGSEVCRGYCLISDTFPNRAQRQQMGPICETPSTCLTILAHPEVTVSHATYGLNQAVNYNFSIWLAGPASCFTTSEILSSKQHQDSVSPQPLYPFVIGPKPSTHSSLPRFTAYLRLGISKNSKLAAISDCFITQEECLQAEHRSGKTLACTAQETTLPMHPVHIYRPCWSTTTLSLHSWSSTESRGWWTLSQLVLAVDWPG